MQTRRHVFCSTGCPLPTAVLAASQDRGSTECPSPPPDGRALGAAPGPASQAQLLPSSGIPNIFGRSTPAGDVDPASASSRLIASATARSKQTVAAGTFMRARVSQPRKVPPSVRRLDQLALNGVLARLVNAGLGSARPAVVAATSATPAAGLRGADGSVAAAASGIAAPARPPWVGSRAVPRGAPTELNSRRQAPLPLEAP